MYASFVQHSSRIFVILLLNSYGGWGLITFDDDSIYIS